MGYDDENASKVIQLELQNCSSWDINGEWMVRMREIT